MYHFVKKETLTKFFGDAGSLKREYVATVLHVWNMAIWTAPLDLIKTRLQIKGDRFDITNRVKQKNPYESFITTGIHVFTVEGTLGLWKGLPPKLMSHTFKIVLYLLLCGEKIPEEKKQILAKFHVIEKIKNAGFMCSIGSYAISSFIHTPLTMARVQLHMAGKRRYLGIKPKASNVIQAIYRAYQIDGIRGMYRGAVPHTFLDVIFLLSQMQFQHVTFSNAEKLGLPRPVSISVTGALSLALTSIFCLPLDVITTRILYQGAYSPNEKNVYKSVLHCAKMIIKEEGIYGFYRGFVPFFLRSGFTAAFYQFTYHIFVFLLGYEF